MAGERSGSVTSLADEIFRFAVDAAAEFVAEIGAVLEKSKVLLCFGDNLEWRCVKHGPGHWFAGFLLGHGFQCDVGI